MIPPLVHMTMYFIHLITPLMTPAFDHYPICHAPAWWCYPPTTPDPWLFDLFNLCWRNCRQLSLSLGDTVTTQWHFDTRSELWIAREVVLTSWIRTDVLQGNSLLPPSPDLVLWYRHLASVPQLNHTHYSNQITNIAPFDYCLVNLLHQLVSYMLVACGWVDRH